jgi:phosphotransferase system enzyme I (PtsI)
MKVTKKEIRIKGIAASPGIAIGTSSKHEIQEQPIIRRQIRSAEVEAEQARLDKAVASAKTELEKIRGDAGKSIGPQVAKIFEAQLLILEDEEFLKQVTEDIRKSKLNAEYVYDRHINRTLQTLSASGDRYLREMAGDIKAIATKVMGYMTGPTSKKLRDSKGRIALADSFSPGEVVLMHKYKIPGFASMRGAVTSHTVLVARSLSIPAVVGATGLCKKCEPDCEIIVDGDAGLVIVNPSKETIEYYREEQKKRQSLTSRQFKSLARIPGTTRDGHEIQLAANIDFPSNTDHVLAAAGIGVGLYRTEFFYMSNGHFPSEDEQTAIYKQVAETYYPNVVTMRMFDLGSDKLSNLHRESPESNPALGWRGIRFDLDQPEVFRTQARAMLRASSLKNLRIMLPMVSAANEIVKAKRLIYSMIQELIREGTECDEQIEVGAMIEVPSAALIADSLARHADFFSIGTNDLVQYTLAVDRNNKKITKLYRELHPGVLRLMKMTIDAANEAGIPVALCGELARRPDAVPLLIGLGLKSLSVSPLALPALKRRISRIHYKECVELAGRVMDMSSTERVEALVRSWNREHSNDLKPEG